MSAAELFPTIQSLPQADKIQLFKLLTTDLQKSGIDTEAISTFVPPPEDQCPCSPAELARMFSDDREGVPLSEIWKKLGRK
jgi:hypothetical protein